MESHKITLFDDMKSLSSRPAFQEYKNTDCNRGKAHEHPNGGEKTRSEPRRSQSLQSSTMQPSNRNVLAKPEPWPAKTIDKPCPTPKRSPSLQSQRHNCKAESETPLLVRNRGDVHKIRPKHDRSVATQPFADDRHELAALRRARSIHVPNRTTNSNDKFKPKKNKWIGKTFSKVKESDEIWIEQTVLCKGKKPRTRFMSMTTRLYRKEPPTGTKTIIYMQDFIVQEETAVAHSKEGAPPKKKNHMVKPKRKSLIGIVKK
eukprot:scaffold160_cov136-Cylindrotheca_fusiformis.AAC.14